MELTIALVITIINCVFVIATFVVNRKDKSSKDAGYDATKTQILKNINGTLTWGGEE